MAYLRLRQIAVVATDLARAEGDVQAVLGVPVCHRDPAVGVFGLVNALLPIGQDFLEIVSPTRPGTTAGRFHDRWAGRYGYMLIFDCDDPLRYKAQAAALGIRVAHEGRHDAYHGVQLHPKDTGATMLEFNHTDGAGPLDGPYWPAGADWQRFVDRRVTERLLCAEVDCADPAAFAGRWSALTGTPVSTEADGTPRLDFDHGAIRFVRAARDEPVFAGLRVAVHDPVAVLAAARGRGLPVTGDGMELCGLRVTPVRV